MSSTGLSPEDRQRLARCDILQVTLHNQASEILRAHEALDQLAAQHGVPARCVTSLHLALEEHLSNIIAYGYTPG